ncbi:hypothetical protein [Cryobacterium adonitolivorans]|nr:hypothetical protein [Cryobacterium adonitolivorans]
MGSDRAVDAIVIWVVIPERSDPVADRKRRGRNGGRPVDLDKEAELF